MKTKQLFLLLLTSLFCFAACTAQQNDLIGFWQQDNGDGTYYAIYFSEQNYCYMSGAITSVDNLESKMYVKYKYELNTEGKEEFITILSDEYGGNNDTLVRIKIGDKVVLYDSIFRGVVDPIDFDNIDYFTKVEGQKVKYSNPSKWLVEGGEWLDNASLYGYDGNKIVFGPNKTFSMSDWTEAGDMIEKKGKYSINGDELKLLFSDNTSETFTIDLFWRLFAPDSTSLYYYSEQRNNLFLHNLVQKHDDTYIEEDNRSLEFSEGYFGLTEKLIIKQDDPSEDSVHNGFRLPSRYIQLFLKNGNELYDDSDKLVARGSFLIDNMNVIALTSDNAEWYIGSYVLLQ